MNKLPDYIGVSAFGIKMGLVLPGSDIVEMVCESLAGCNRDGLLHDGDTICLTESVVARSQNNYVSTDDIAREITRKMQIGEDARIGVVFPILSRNRFSLVLKGIAMAVPRGEVLVQLSYPADEVGNQLLPEDFAESVGKANGDVIHINELGDNRFLHPITGVDYIQLYQNIIMSTGARPYVYLCNDPLKVAEFVPDGVIVANVHGRFRTRSKLETVISNCLTLQDLCSSIGNGAWSEWGLLGSNLSSGDRLKLAPREASEIALAIQRRVREELGKNVEVVIYGDGAYCDPSTGIYELADPQPAFGITPGLENKYREGLKYKYLVDTLYQNGYSEPDIERILLAKMKEHHSRDSFETEGTTPRKVEDIIASLADLVSGSADAGTPLVIVKGFLGSAHSR